jgi:hypothetical protein
MCGRAIAQVVIRRLLTVGPGSLRSIYVGFVVGKAALGQVFLPNLSVFPSQNHSTAAQIHSRIIWRMDKGSVSGPVPQRHSLKPIATVTMTRLHVVNMYATETLFLPHYTAAQNMVEWDKAELNFGQYKLRLT